jgi:hypothetical protein
MNPAMNHFSLKSLGFYGAAISSVLVLFKIVTFYGENRLQASPPIAGTYRLTPSVPSACLGENPRLAIEQSGIYLLGTLSIRGTNIPLEGRFQGDRLGLSGSATSLSSCADPLAIGAVAGPKTLTGTVAGIPVTFQKEEMPGESPSSGH